MNWHRLCHTDTFSDFSQAAIFLISTGSKRFGYLNMGIAKDQNSFFFSFEQLRLYFNEIATTVP